ncbi:aminopeptidase P family protein [Sediminitomix flava]|uniref:Xaa-Pro aminopeptidase n=1 Tax=Sediminitomix flava TaxID=379075 RepID=A0A315Z5X5_SEDFL|nr:aminopeptidase P family protein [Sediminitomix flava]PWJ39257.1 aminopeptidase P [Sediminitomix flava]
MRILLFIGMMSFLSFSVFAQFDAEGYLDKDFHKSRREAFRTSMEENSVAVLFANPIRNRANDVDFIYHQDPDFYYLTGYREPHAVLLIFSETQTSPTGVTFDELLFVQPKNELYEMWTGERLGIEGTKTALGFENVFANTDFEAFELNFDNFDRLYFYAFHNDVRDNVRDNGDLFSLIEQFKSKASIPKFLNKVSAHLYQMIRSTDIENSANVAQVIAKQMDKMPLLKLDPYLKEYVVEKDEENRLKIASKLPDHRFDILGLEQRMAALREVKTEAEVQLLRKAVRISTVGQEEVMKAMNPSISEREVQGIHEFVFKKYGAEYEGYPSIVGAGHNGCVLHYIDNKKQQIEDGELILMDLGAQFRGYTADVTRTIPVNGKFSKEQKQIYELVLKAQEEGIAACRVGAEFGSPNKAAAKVIKEGLLELGIIENEKDYRKYFPHGTSHHIGLDVHDKSNYGEFQHNMIITVEPGIYIPKGSPCDEKWWDIAVRIEDDILITNEGVENLSADAPRTVKEIEALMKKESILSQFILPKI